VDIGTVGDLLRAMNREQMLRWNAAHFLARNGRSLFRCVILGRKDARPSATRSVGVMVTTNHAPSLFVSGAS